MKNIILKSVSFAAALVFTFSANVYANDVYNVQHGDSLWRISEKYGVKLEEIINSNPQFTNPNLIYPKDKVSVPIEKELEKHEYGKQTVHLKRSMYMKSK